MANNVRKSKTKTVNRKVKTENRNGKTDAKAALKEVKIANVKGKVKVEKKKLKKALSGIITLSMMISKLRGKYASNKTVDKLEQSASKIFVDLSDGIKNNKSIIPKTLIKQK